MSSNMHTLATAAAFFPLLGAIAAGLFGEELGRKGAHRVTILGVAISCFFSLGIFVRLVVNGEPRAYLLEGMSAADHHIANDSVGAESFSVVYCPRSSTVRCLATPKNQQDQLKIKGWFKDSLQLEYQTNQFSIEADSLPLPEMEIAMTSLAAWRQRHPDSKIYLGDFPQVLKAVDPRRSTGDTPRKGTLPRRS